MKIGIYVGNLDPKVGGESTLTKTILNEINKLDDKEYDIVFLYKGKNNSIYKSIINGYEYICINNCCNLWHLIGNGLVESLGGASNRFFGLDKIAKKEHIDMFYFAAPVLAPTSYPYIFTVWDLGHRTTPYFPEVAAGKEWGYREKMYNTMLPRATYIITGNETGKMEILEYYNVDKNKIVEIPFPVTINRKNTEKRPDFILDDDFFFYPAQFWAHKNHICIVEAMAILRDKYHLTPRCYFTGSDKGNLEYIKTKIKSYKLDNQIIITGFVEDEELNYLYTHATAMIFASLMGPNNLPPIEAVYYDCPVIISDIPGHREQMKDAALFFDAYRADSLAEKMKLVLSDSTILDNIKNKTKLKKELCNVNYYKNVFSYFDLICEIRKRWIDK